MRVVGLEPTLLAETEFESVASTVPPHPHLSQQIRDTKGAVKRPAATWRWVSETLRRQGKDERPALVRPSYHALFARLQRIHPKGIAGLDQPAFLSGQEPAHALIG